MIYVSRIRIGRIGQKIIIHTRPILSLVWTRLVHRVDPIRRGDKYSSPPRGRARPFIHSFARVIRAIIRETRTRADATRRSDPIPSIRSFASIRSHRFVHFEFSRSARARSRRPIADSPLGPSRRARESSIEGCSIVGSLSLPVAVDVDAPARAAETERVDFHSRSRSRGRRGRDARRRRRRRDDATRSIDARRRGVGEDTRERAWIDGPRVWVI